MVTGLNWPSTLPGDPSVSLGSTLFWSLQLPFQTAYFLQAPSFSPIFFCTIRRQQKTLLSTLRKLNQIIQKGISWEIPKLLPSNLLAYLHLDSSFPSFFYSVEEGSYLLSRSNLTTYALNTTLFHLHWLSPFSSILALFLMACFYHN